jgi:hypothetical protein
MKDEIITINILGNRVSAKHFAYDGCHKIYILEDEIDYQEAINNGYEIKRMKSIKSAYHNSCSLKFISNWKLTKCYAGQGDRWYPYGNPKELQWRNWLKNRHNY